MCRKALLRHNVPPHSHMNTSRQPSPLCLISTVINKHRDLHITSYDVPEKRPEQELRSDAFVLISIKRRSSFYRQQESVMPLEIEALLPSLYRVAHIRLSR